MTSLFRSRGFRAWCAATARTQLWLALAVWAVALAGAAPCGAAQTAAPAAPVAVSPPPPVAGLPLPPPLATPAGKPAAPRPAVPAVEAVEASDAETSEGLSAEDLNKALSDDLVTLGTSNLRALLGEKPEFVYDPHNRRDPMLLPWEHLRVRALALLTEADKAFRFGNLDLAERLYGMVRTTVSEAEAQALPGQELFDKFREQADAGLQKVMEEKTRAVHGTSVSAGRVPQVQLPVWVRTHTNGVVFSQKEPLCLVGSYLLKVGDKVPGQSVDVVVVKIEKRAVTYRVAGETFVVGLEEGE